MPNQNNTILLKLPCHSYTPFQVFNFSQRTFIPQVEALRQNFLSSFALRLTSNAAVILSTHQQGATSLVV